MEQTSFNFPTTSLINIEKLSRQNKRLYEWLIKGNRINCMSPAMQILNIGYLNSRISDLRNKFKIPVKDEFIQVEFNGEKTTVKSYWVELNQNKL